MKSSILTTLGLSSTALAAVSIKIAANPEPASHKMSRRQLMKRDPITESLANNITGGSYIASVSVGTPPQPQTLIIDTGSSDVWLLDAGADLCVQEELQEEEGTGCSTTFNAGDSSSFKTILADGFDISYQDGTGSSGDYVSDDFSIGGATVQALEMGLAFNTTVPTGLMGIGYDTNEAAESIYPNIIDDMVKQGLIATKAYSLYLDDLQSSTGSIIFGGMDTDKYHGDLLALPIVPNAYGGQQIYAEFAVALTGLTVSSTSVNTTISSTAIKDPVILDSGTTISYIPDKLAALLYTAIGAVDDTFNTGNVYVDCNLVNDPEMSVNYGFSSTFFLRVPMSELVFNMTGLFALPPGYSPPDDLPFDNVCGFGIQPADGGPNLLGDTFLRSAYVVYDLENNEIAIGQTNFESSDTNIVDFTATQTSIPDVSGVASSAGVTATVSGPVGGGGSGHTTSFSSTAGGSQTSAHTSSGTGSASASTSTTHNAAPGTVPAFNVAGLLVMGVSVAFAVVGGGLFLA